MKEYFLKTARVGFSIWNDKDIDDVLKLWGNPEVTKFITKNGTMLKEEVMERLKKEIDNYRNNKIQYWPIYSIESNENIGCCGLREYDVKKNIVEIGVHLKKEHWGKGYAKEACLAVMKYAFENLKVKGIFAGHNPENTASGKLLKKLGFTYTHDEFYPPTGLNHPSYLIKKDEYNLINI